MRNMLLTSALSGSLALYPQALLAQDYDTWALNREVLNAAANYTGVLTTAHAQVRKYITWDWNTLLTAEDQKQRTEDLLHEITTRQQITAALVPGLDSAVIDGFGIRFRYCDGMLLSYFTSTGFKHGLSAQQIVDAPVLRARRADTTFTGEPLGIVETVDDPAADDPTVGGNLILQTGDRRQAIHSCMGDDYDGALPANTVAYMTSAVRKLGPRDDLSQEDTKTGPACPTTHPVGNKTRTVERHYRFEDSIHLQDFPVLRDAVAENYGEWEADDSCWRIVNKPTTEPVPANCATGEGGNISKERVKTVTGREWHSGREQLSTTYGEPYTVSNTCRDVPPPPPPPKTGYKSCHRGDCWWVDTSGGRNGGGSDGGGSDGGGRDEGSSDVGGDGVGDYNDHDSRGFGGTSVSSGCGACNGPSSGPTGGDNNGGGGNKIVCTAMNARYGFGSYRQAIWLAHARRMSPYHQTGYHLIFLPLVRYGYRSEGKTRLAVRHALEHIARHRTVDLRAEMQQRKRRILGRSYRAVLEPLCYAVGWLAGGRTVAGVADVAQIATPRKSAKPTPKHFKNNIGEVQ